MMTSRPIVSLTVLWVLSTVGADVARGEDLIQGLQKAAPTIVDFCKEKGFTNVGVLKFLVQKDGGPLTDNVGPMNLSLARSLELSLYLETTPKTRVKIVRDASLTAATIPEANHLQPEGRAKLFRGGYRPQWGKEESVKPDAFLTGEAIIDKDKMTVIVRWFDVKSPPTMLLSFKAVAMAQDYCSVGASFRLRGGIGRDGKPAFTAKDLKESVDEARSKPEHHPLHPKANALVGLTIRYNDKPVPIEFKDGVATVKEPLAGEKVTLTLTRLPAAEKERLAVVLKVNGENTLYRQRLRDEDCTKWILEPDTKEITVRGFQKDEKTAEEFVVLPRRLSKKDEIRYGEYAGTISISVFRERKVKEEPQPLKGQALYRAIIARGQYPDKVPENMYALEEQLKNMVGAETLKGLIREGEKIGSSFKEVDFDLDPVPLQAATVSYYRPTETMSFKEMYDKGNEFTSLTPPLFDEARELLSEMQRLAEAEGEPEWGILARWKKAHCEFNQGDYSLARKTLEAAIARTPKGNGMLVILHRDLGEFCLRSWEWETAERHLAEAMNLRDKEAVFMGNPQVLDPPVKLRIELLHAQALNKVGEEKEARKRLERILEQAKTGRDAEKNPILTSAWECLPAECLIEISEMDAVNSNPTRANERLTECLADLKDRPTWLSRLLEFQCHIHLARNYLKLARYDRARDELARAEKRLEKIRTEGTVRDLAHNRALMTVEEAAFAIERNPEREDLSKLLDKAEELAEAALKLCTESGAPSHLTGKTRWYLARVHDLRGRFLEMHGEAKQARREYDTAGRGYNDAVKELQPAFPEDDDFLLGVRRFRASLAIRQEKLAEARKEAKEIFDLHTKKYGEDHVTGGLFHQLFIELEDHAGNPEEAQKHARKHRSLADTRLVPHLAGLTPTEQVQFFRTWYDPGLLAAIQLGIHHEKARGASVEALLNGKAKLKEVLAAVNRYPRDEEKHKALQNVLQHQAFLLYGSPDREAEELQREFDRQESKRRDFTASALARGLSEKPVTVDDLRRSLTPDEVYLDVVRLPAGKGAPATYHAWVVKQEGKIVDVDLGPAHRIDRLISDFVDHQKHYYFMHRLKDGPLDAERNLRETCLLPLSRLLFHPLIKNSDGKKRWIVSPDGPLWNVPWGALMPEDGRYAVEEFTFRSVISGRDLVRKHQSDVKIGDPMIIGDAAFGHKPREGEWRPRNPGDPFLSLKDLPASRLECLEVARCLGPVGGKPIPVESGDITKDALFKLTVPPRILYLSTHGFFLEPRIKVGDPLLCCGVTFSGLHHLPANEKGTTLPGVLTGAEVLALKLGGTDLVVLSACESGTGIMEYGQSPADLRHSFHLAGARAVVSSLWSVEDQATKDLMVAFMKSLYGDKDGDKADALRKAQLEIIEGLRDQRLPHSHPFYWAAFTLSGS